MIIRFGVENWKSIKGYQELLLTSATRIDGDVDLISSESLKGALVPSCAIYGANASGKSNVLDAIKFFKSGILRSSKLHDGFTGRDPFRLDQKSKGLPTRMDCDFITDGVRYHYGFEIDDTQINEEWLYAYPSGSRQVWFHRNTSEDEPFSFGRMLKGQNKVISELTRTDSLFISHAAENNHNQLTTIYDFFKKNIIFYLKQSIIPAHVLEKAFEDECLKEQVMAFIRSADTGIVEAIVERDDFDLPDDEFLDGLSALVVKTIAKDGVDVTSSEVRADFRKNIEKNHKKISFSHKAAGDKTERLTFESESRGTQHLISLLIPIFKTINAGGVLFIDEIDTSLHPLLSVNLVKLFNSKKTNPNQAQLIFTTHDTTFLAGSNLRRDQVWFTEKNREGATKLFPLTDYKLRPNDNKEKAYLKGYVGGIPVMTSIDSIAAALMSLDCG